MEYKPEMKMIHKLWKLFLYAGLEKEAYDDLLPVIRKENTVLLSVFSMIAAVMFFVLFITSLISGGFVTVNTSTYLLSTIEMIIILICAHCVVPRHPSLVMVLVYVFEIMLYLFGISISMLHAESPAVSAVAFLLVSPLLFYDHPVRLSGMIAAVVAIFCGLAVRFKRPDVAHTDVWNAITFGIVAIATTVFTMSIKIRALAQSKQIEYLSQTDLLTGAKNRNHYENSLQSYPKHCLSNLICVYADANGLHEMNNTKGHPAGDRMLREVATVMQRFFGQEHTYRVGGDEFVGFQMDGRPKELLANIERMWHELKSKGYNVSFGSAVYEMGSPSVLNMHDLVRAAEKDMFASKRNFYRQAGNDRRSR